MKVVKRRQNHHKNPTEPSKETCNALVIRLPPEMQNTSSIPGSHEKRNDPTDNSTVNQQIIQGIGFKLHLLPTVVNNAHNKPSEEEASDEETERSSRHTFCPAEHTNTVINMMEKHYCAHPSIPGYAAPNGSSIKWWAVQQMYKFCSTNELPELWAYLWENWYRKGRWQLWARSVHEMVPILKTTMILESQWVNLHLRNYIQLTSKLVGDA